GQFDDPTILFVGDVEVVEVRQMDDDPFIITQFHCQQLKCTRDKFGNVTDGSTNSIQRVYYFWGLQQEKVGVVTADGQLLPPRWVIRDMMWQSMLALV
ncbi:mitochondrial inner membrane translocase, partial [Haematococcus lacustris]